MSNEIKIFESKEFGNVRVVMQENEPWFVAKDVCDVLMITNTTQKVALLDDGERCMFNIGRQGEANCVSEYGILPIIERD
jgi:prophage antirepressor-like protein